MSPFSSPRRGGFTLVELLVVILIILIISVAALAVVMPAVQSQGVSSAALLLQAELSRARDEAVRYNQPRGLRLLPDRDGPFAFPGTTPGQRWGYSRIIALEPGPNYEEGEVRNVIAPTGPVFTTTPNYSDGPVLVQGGSAFSTAITPQAPLSGNPVWFTLWESKYSEIYGTPTPTGGQPRSSTSWYWNIRRGDKIRIGPQGNELTVVGPILVTNAEGFINWGDPTAYNSTPSSTVPSAASAGPAREFLIVLDGLDNDNDGYVDEAWDGVDNDGDGLIDPLFNGIDDPDYTTGNTNSVIDDPGEFRPGEWEPEGIPVAGGPVNYAPTTPREAVDNHALGATYTILRRALPSPKSRELTLPTGILIDMTSSSPMDPAEIWERSRLPVDWATGYVDIMISPSGQLTSTSYAGRSRGLGASTSFLHFWLTDTDDVFEPDYSRMYSSRTPPTPATVPIQPILPLPATTPGFVSRDEETVLKGHRRLVTVNARTGQITTSTLDPYPNDSSKSPLNLEGLQWVTGASAIDTRAIVLSRPYRRAEAGLKEQP